MVIYHVKPGKEAELQDVLARAWEVYQKNHMVLAQPHVIVRDKGIIGETRFVEIFTWVSHSVPQRPPDAVKKLWDQMQTLCVPQDGRGGLEGGEVGLLVP